MALTYAQRIPDPEQDVSISLRYRGRDWYAAIGEWVEAIVFALAVAVFLFGFCIQIKMVDGDSMLPTLHTEDRVATYNLFYQPKPGDIVVVAKPKGYDKPLIKRVVATGGQTVDIDFVSGRVTVDGQLLDEPYISEKTHLRGAYPFEFPVTVPEGSVFVLGDNRNYSSDSRDFGFVENKQIMGKAFARIYPFDSIDWLT